MADQPCRVMDDVPEQLCQQVFERDDHVCQRCRDREVEDTLEVHRLVPHSESEDSEPVEDLITLCCSCHAVMHPDDDSVDSAREQATLFPHPDAPEAVSRMRLPADHVCERCLYSIPDSTNLVAYDVETDPRTLMLCKPCAGVLYDHDDSFDVGALRAGHRFPAHELSERKSSSLWTPHTNADPAVAVEWTPETDGGTREKSPEPTPDTQVTESENESTIISLIRPLFLSPFAFLPAFFLFWMLVLPYTGDGGLLPIITAIVPTYLLAVIILVLDRVTDGAIAADDLAIGIDVLCGVIAVVIALWSPVATILWFLWGIPLVSLIEYGRTVPALVAGIVFSLAMFCAIAALYARWKTEAAVGSSLILKMVLIPIVLFSLLIAFFTAVWRVVERAVLIGLALVGPPPDAPTVAWTITAVLLTAFALNEIRQFNIVEQYEETTPTSPEASPKLYSIMTPIAAQLDVPMPSIALSESKVPEAIAVGYRPGNLTLILSRSLIDALDEEELEAVIAHELAHIANMDAMVLSIASLPIFFAESLQSRMKTRLGLETIDSEKSDGGFIDEFIWNVKNKSPHNFVWFLLMMVAVLTRVASYPFVLVLSRARELAADRTAALVTGSPAALASSLQTLDERIDETPDEDLRELSGLSSLSILPLGSIDSGWLFGTHPPTERRIAMLADLAAEQEQSE